MTFGKGNRRVIHQRDGGALVFQPHGLLRRVHPVVPHDGQGHVRHGEGDVYLQQVPVFNLHQDLRSGQRGVGSSGLLLAAVVAQHGAAVGAHPLIPVPGDAEGVMNILNVRPLRIEHVGDGPAGGVIDNVELPVQKRGIDGPAGQKPQGGGGVFCNIDGSLLLPALGQGLRAAACQRLFQLAAAAQQHGPVLRGHVDIPGGVVQLGDFEIVPVVGRRHGGEAQQDHQDRHHGQSLHQGEAAASFVFKALDHVCTSIRVSDGKTLVYIRIGYEKHFNISESDIQ